jgi:hypothetical protein
MKLSAITKLGDDEQVYLVEYQIYLSVIFTYTRCWGQAPALALITELLSPTSTTRHTLAGGTLSPFLRHGKL